MSTDQPPTAQQVLAVLAAEHHPYTGTFMGRPVQYCAGCATDGASTRWPCRVHRLATQPTADLVALGARVPNLETTP